jgi:hypothetical protein
VEVSLLNQILGKVNIGYETFLRMLLYLKENEKIIS